MKKIICESCMLWIISLLFALDLKAQVNEMPITSSSHKASNFFYQGRANLENLENTVATMLFNKAIELDPKFAMAYLYRAQSGGGFNVYRKNLGKAIKLSEKVTAGEKLQIMAAKAEADGDFPKQHEYIEQLLKEFPTDKRIQMLAGNFLYDAGKYTEALAYYTKSIELDNQFPPPYNRIGYCNSLINNYVEAEKAFQTYIQLIPEKANPYDSYGALLLKMGKFDESITYYKKALDIDPAYGTSMMGLGDNYIFKNDNETARNYYKDCYDKVSDIDLKLESVLMKAVSFVHEDKTENALTTFDELRTLAINEELIPNAVYSYAYQGYIHTENGNLAEGAKCFIKADELIEKSKLSEADINGMTTASMIWRIYYLTANNELEKAMAESDKCKINIESRKNPRETESFNASMGILELKKGNYDKAIQYFSESDPLNPMSWYYSAVAYSQKGDQQKASELFEKISTWNVNTLELALVRKRAKEELSK